MWLDMPCRREGERRFDRKMETKIYDATGGAIMGTGMGLVIFEFRFSIGLTGRGTGGGDEDVPAPFALMKFVFMGAKLL